MLIGQGTFVVTKQGDKLRHLAKWRAVVEQVLLSAPVAAFLGLKAQAPQVGNRVLAEVIVVLLGIDNGIDQAREPLV